MTIKELKDLLNTIIPANDVLVKSEVVIITNNGVAEVKGLQYAHSLGEDSESESLQLFMGAEKK